MSTVKIIPGALGSPEDVEVFYDGVEDMVGVGVQELVSTSLYRPPWTSRVAKAGAFKASGSEAEHESNRCFHMLEKQRRKV